MQLSARNQLKGRITEIKTDGISSEIILDIGGQEVCSNITTDSVNNLGIKVGDEADRVIIIQDEVTVPTLLLSLR
jgi:molybdopterin-binding protein